MKHLKIMTCGSVDDGKSTLLGRLIYETGNLNYDQSSYLEKLNQKYRNKPKNLDYSLLVDGLIDEKEQGITIDLAFKYLVLGDTQITLIDSPGHVEYTKNKSYLESKLFVLDHINADLNLQIPRGSYGLYRGQSELSALVSGRSDARLNIHIKNVLGDTEYDRITKKVANDLGFDRVPSNFTATWLMSPTSQGSTIAKQNQFVQAMIRELIKHPEFKVISESET